MCHHEEDFRIPAEWHFSTSQNEKVRVTAWQEQRSVQLHMLVSLDHTMAYSDQILTLLQLYDFSCCAISSANFYYTTVAEHEYETTLLQERIE